MNSEPRQLTFDFVDSPKGGESRDPVGEPTGERASTHTSMDKRQQAMRPARGDRATGLLVRAASIEVLEEAMRKVASNKGAPGPDGQTVEQMVAQKATILRKLSKALLSGSYQPGGIRRCWIPKPGGGRRGLGIPNVQDRVVQQALLHVLEPLFEPHFHPSSHGFRPGRGANTAIPEAGQHVKEAGLGYVVDIDLESFFDRVHHQRLLDRLQQWIDDMPLVRLIGKLLRAEVVMPDGVRVNVEEGVPQGGPLSPLLANIVLDELDWELERRGHRFVRYADDCNIFVRSPRAGERVMASTRKFIETRLRLKVNEGKSAVAPAGERHFLGFVVGVTDSGELMVNLSPRTLKRIYTRLQEILPRGASGSLPQLVERVMAYLRGWMGYFGRCTQEVEYHLRGIEARARRRLRAIFVCRFRRPGFLARALVRLGAPRRAALAAAHCRRGPWHTSHRVGVERALPNRYFTRLGLDLHGLWQRHPARAAGPG